jgi:Tfp pilus assembly ATPase PilU
MAGMYQLKDLLIFAAQESAEELLLEPDQPPRLRLHGKVRVLDGPLLTTDEVSALLNSIANQEQRRELEVCGDTHFRYAAGHSAQFNVHARTHGNRLYVKIHYLGPQ